MKKITLFILTILLMSSCASVSRYNNYIKTLRTVEQLKSDVDFAYNKLKKHHPNLYQYISKEKLDFKFDSLKLAINKPMTSNDFFFQLSPVIAFIRQGHNRLYPLTKKMTKKEKRVSKNKTPLPVS